MAKRTTLVKTKAFMHVAIRKSLEDGKEFLLVSELAYDVEDAKRKAGTETDSNWHAEHPVQRIALVEVKVQERAST